MTGYQSCFAPWLPEFLEFRDVRGYEGENSESIARQFDSFVNREGLKRPDQIDTGLVHRWIHSAPLKSPSQKNDRLGFIRLFCRYLQRMDVVIKDPTVGIPYIKCKPEKPTIFTLKEVGQLLEEASQLKKHESGERAWTGWTMDTLIHLLYACGLRIREALNLQVIDVNFRENTLSLWRTKFHKERLIPFSNRIQEKLEAYLEERNKRFPRFRQEDTPFFCHAKGSYHYATILGNYHRLLIKCGLKKERGPRLHDLRHTFAVHRLYKWYQDGHDIMNKLPLLSTYMGHVSVEDTQVYLTVSRSLLRQANFRFREHAEHIPRRVLARILKHDNFRRS